MNLKVADFHVNFNIKQIKTQGAQMDLNKQ